MFFENSSRRNRSGLKTWQFVDKNEGISNGKRNFYWWTFARGEIEDTFKFCNSVDKLFLWL